MCGAPARCCRCRCSVALMPRLPTCIGQQEGHIARGPPRARARPPRMRRAPSLAASAGGDITSNTLAWTWANEGRQPSRVGSGRPTARHMPRTERQRHKRHACGGARAPPLLRGAHGVTPALLSFGFQAHESTPWRCGVSTKVAGDGATEQRGADLSDDRTYALRAMRWERKRRFSLEPCCTLRLCRTRQQHGGAFRTAVPDRSARAMFPRCTPVQCFPRCGGGRSRLSVRRWACSGGGGKPTADLHGRCARARRDLSSPDCVKRPMPKVFRRNVIRQCADGR